MIRAARFSSSDFAFLDTIDQPLSRLEVLHDGSPHLTKYAVSTEWATEGDVSLKLPELDPSATADTLIAWTAPGLRGFSFLLFVHGIPPMQLTTFRLPLKHTVCDKLFD